MRMERFDILGKSSYLTRKPDKVYQLDQTFVSQISDPWVFSFNETLFSLHICVVTIKRKYAYVLGK